MRFANKFCKLAILSCELPNYKDEISFLPERNRQQGQSKIPQTIAIQSLKSSLVLP